MRPERARVRLVRALGIAGLALCVGGVRSTHAGPWLPEPGHFYLELRGQLGTTNEGFDSSGARRTLGGTTSSTTAVPTRLFDAQLQLYGEIGLATRLAVIADFIPLRSVTLARSGSSDVAATGIGDLHAGLRLLLFDEEVTCSLEVKLGVPTGRSDGAVPLGPGDLRGDATLSVGHVWERVPIYGVVELGYALRSSGTQRVDATQLPLGPSVTTATVNYASELVYAAELGYLAHPGPRLRLSPRVRFDGLHGVRAPTVASVPGQPADLVLAPIVPASLRFVRIGASLGAEIALPSQRAQPVSYLILDLAGGAFVWGQGVPAIGQVSFAVGWKR